MIEALFLNPLTKAQMKGRSKKSSGRAVSSKRLKGWQAMVKKHSGDLKSAAAEWKSQSSSGSSSRRGAGTSRRRKVRGRLSGLAARRAASHSKGAKGGVPMAARKRKTKKRVSRRRRNSGPPQPTWITKWREGVKKARGKYPKKPKFKKISSDPRKGYSQWKRKTKRKSTAAMKAHRRTRKSAGAKRFATRTMRGMAAWNPITAEQYIGRYVRGTGFRPHYRKGPAPMTPAWKRKTAAGVKRKGARRYASKISNTEKLALKYQQKTIEGLMRGLRKKNPVKSRRGRKARRGSKMKKYSIMKASRARSLMLNIRPKRRKSKRRKTSRRTYRRRNPVGASFKAMVSKSALESAAYVAGGVAVGAIVPNIVTKYLFKGEAKAPWVEALIGVGGSLAAGIGVSLGMKNDAKGALVLAGGIAGAVGNLIANQLNQVLGFSGFGGSAEDALRSAVETEMERAGLTGMDMGQFLLPGEAESVPGASGLGQFLTEAAMQTDVAQTEGLGQSMDLEETGSAAFAGIDGSVF